MSKSVFRLISGMNYHYTNKESGKPSDINSRMQIMSIMFCIVEEIHVVK